MDVFSFPSNKVAGPRDAVARWQPTFFSLLKRKRRADMEISSRTIIMLILFIVLAVIIIGIGIVLSTQSAGTVANFTNIAESFTPGA